MVEIEEHDYSKNLLKNSQDQKYLGLNPVKELPQRKTIPVDQSVIAAFHQALREKNSLSAKYNTAIKLAKKDIASSNTASQNLLTQANQLEQKIQTHANEREKLTVNISSAAKNLQNSVLPVINNKVNRTTPDVRPKNNQLDLDIIQKNSTPVDNIVKNKKNFDSKVVNNIAKQSDSIFDEIISEDSNYQIKIENNAPPFKIKGDANAQPAENAAEQPKIVFENKKHKPAALKETEKTGAPNLTDQLSSAEDEVLAEAKKLAQAGEIIQSTGTIKNFLDSNDIPVKPAVLAELVYLMGTNQLKEENFEAARDNLIDYFSNKINKDDPDFEKKLDNVSDIFESKGAQKFALPFFITALSIKRENQNFQAMDSIYNNIIKAYADLAEEDKMIEGYQNQLAIKRRLGDIEGQLDLLDKLGKLYYDQKNNGGYSFCYQQTIEIKKKMLEANSTK